METAAFITTAAATVAILGGWAIGALVSKFHRIYGKPKPDHRIHTTMPDW